LIEKRLAAGKATAKETDKDADLKLLVGTWEIQARRKAIWQFSPDGRLLQDGKTPGRWTANKMAVKITWKHNAKAWDILKRPITKNAVGDSWLGKGLIRATKVDGI